VGRWSVRKRLILLNNGRSRYFDMAWSHVCLRSLSFVLINTPKYRSRSQR
jgi:hypothetical protein